MLSCIYIKNSKCDPFKAQWLLEKNNILLMCFMCSGKTYSYLSAAALDYFIYLFIFLFVFHWAPRLKRLPIIAAPGMQRG